MTESIVAPQKVKARHLQRDAYVYVRQSSMRQVLENTESTLRQYQLRERALALGWRTEQIHVIDCDQGCSGASEAGRDGFQQLVAEVSLGKVGIVMGLEVSRLARNNADWHRLLQLCAFADSLILDQDGLYDPAAFNDRLLLGLKGTMSEAELHVLRSRLQEGILNKARRGELKVPLPVGLAYDERQQVVLAADRQIREALERFFASFRRLGSAFAVVREFRREHLEMPHYSRTGPKSTQVIWGDLTHSQALRILHNPRYAGAFAFGRTRSRRAPDGRIRYSKPPVDEWISMVRDAHPGCLGWDEYERNVQTLKANAQAYSNDRRTPPREGPGLLQGLVICGVCGKRMTLRYHQRQGRRLVPDYVCQREKIEDGGTRDCQVIHGAAVDVAVGELLVTMLNEQSIDLAVAVRRELESRLNQTDQARRQQVERCRYEADLAQRRYRQVDPDKRYVAEVLEAEWNDKLRQLEQAQTECEQARQRDRQALDAQQLAAVGTLANDFRVVWQADTLAARDRKRMVRLLLDDVTLLRGDESVTAHLRFRGGTCRTLTLPRARPAWEARQTSGEVIAAIDQLLDEHPEYRIAEILNARGLHSGTGQRFTQHRVERLRRSRHLASRQDRLRRHGKLTVRELAARLGVGDDKIRQCQKHSLLTAHEFSHGRYLYDDPGPDAASRFPQLKPFAHVTSHSRYQ